MEKSRQYARYILLNKWYDYDDNDNNKNNSKYLLRTKENVFYVCFNKFYEHILKINQLFKGIHYQYKNEIHNKEQINLVYLISHVYMCFWIFY